MATPAQHIIRLAFGFAVSQALRVVADLEIADRLAPGERSVDDLAADGKAGGASKPGGALSDSSEPDG